MVIHMYDGVIFSVLKSRQLQVVQFSDLGVPGSLLYFLYHSDK